MLFLYRLDIYFVAVSLLFNVSRVFLWEVRVQEHHPVVHNLEVLGEQVQVAVELAEEGVYVRVVDLDNKWLGSFEVLRLDDQVMLSCLVDLDSVDTVTQVLFTPKQYFFLDSRVLWESRWQRFTLITGPIARRRVPALPSIRLTLAIGILARSLLNYVVRRTIIVVGALVKARTLRHAGH